MMQPSPPDHPPTPSPTPPRSRVTVGTVVTGLLSIVLLLANMVFGVRWCRSNQSLAAIERESETLAVSNAALAPAYDVLRNRNFEICNRTQDEVEVGWVAATYEEAGALKVFDSRRCPTDWQALRLKAGQNRTVNLSSTQEGCNWNGAVIFYAVHLTRISERAAHSYTLADAYRNVEKDCFTIK
jgi:hypothetical protein